MSVIRERFNFSSSNCFSADVVPMSASVAYALIYGAMNQDILAAGIFMIAAVVMLFKHRDNIQRIKNGQEVHFSYLWNKDKEIERIKENGAVEGK